MVLAVLIPNSAFSYLQVLLCHFEIILNALTRKIRLYDFFRISPLPYRTPFLFGTGQSLLFSRPRSFSGWISIACRRIWKDFPAYPKDISVQPTRNDPKIPHGPKEILPASYTITCLPRFKICTWAKSRHRWVSPGRVWACFWDKSIRLNRRVMRKGSLPILKIDGIIFIGQHTSVGFVVNRISRQVVPVFQYLTRFQWSFFTLFIPV